MQIVGIDAVRYGVDDLENCRRFWIDFGLEEIGGRPNEVLLRTVEGSEIGLRRRGDSYLPPPAPEVAASDIREVVWGVASNEVLGAIEAELSKDRRVHREEDGEIRTIDDSGYGVAFRVTRWKAADTHTQPVNFPHRPARVNTRIDFSAPVKVRNIGHVAIHLPDYRLAERFYGERLGFRLSDSFPGRGVFLRAAGSHCHHNIFALTRPGTVGVHHVSFEVEDFQQVLLGGMRMEKRGWQTRTGPGRHMVGSNYFWYFVAPCGGAAEYYSDMDYLTDDWQPREWEHRPEIVAPWNANPGV